MEKDDPDTFVLDSKNIAAVREVASLAAAQAGKSLASILKKPVRVSIPEVVNIDLREIPGIFGGMDTPAIGVLVPFQGDVDGNALLLFAEESTREFEKAVLKRSGEKGEELRFSAFAEIANILTGSLLTVLSSLSEKIVISLPPFLVRDMAGAIVDTLLAEVGAWSDEITTVIFRLTGPDGQNLVRSVLIPGESGVELFLEAAGRLRKGP